MQTECCFSTLSYLASLTRPNLSVAASTSEGRVFWKAIKHVSIFAMRTGNGHDILKVFRCFGNRHWIAIVVQPAGSSNIAVRHTELARCLSNPAGPVADLAAMHGYHWPAAGRYLATASYLTAVISQPYAALANHGKSGNHLGVGKAGSSLGGSESRHGTRWSFPHCS